jgi:PAS domain S-box-containing protein
MAGLMGSDKLQADESEAYFRNLLESAPDAMIIVDDTGEIAIVNGQAERMFGFDRAEMLGKKIEMLLPDSVRKSHVSHRTNYINDPSLRPMGPGLELVGQRKDGSEFPVEISLSPVSTPKASFVSSVIRDVTRRKRMEQEIIAAQEAAERANKANSAFLAAASHDLRQPVQALSLLNGALRRTVKDERALEMIESQEHSLTAMTNLLNSLLDISRLDAQLHRIWKSFRCSDWSIVCRRNLRGRRSTKAWSLSPVLAIRVFVVIPTCSARLFKTWLRTRFAIPTKVQSLCAASSAMDIAILRSKTRVLASTRINSRPYSSNFTRFEQRVAQKKGSAWVLPSFAD